MYTLKDVANEYRRLDQILGVDTSNIELVRFTGNTSAGYCSVHKEKPVKIGINELLFGCSEKEFYDTVRHEYAHAINAMKYKSRGHNQTWKQICKTIGCTPLGRIPENSELQKKFDQLTVQTAKYKITCPSCGQVYCYQRKGSVVSAYYAGSELVCPVCRRKFSINTNKEKE